MATTRLYLDLRGKAKDGKGNIIITISHNRTTTSIATGIRIAKSEWNGKQVVGRSDADILNAFLQKQKNRIDTRLPLLRLEDEFEDMTAAEIKDAISVQRPKKSKEKHSIISVFEDYLDQPLSSGTKMLYNVTLKWALEYGGQNLKIEDLDYKWILGFENYLSKWLSVNSRSIYLRNLRSICNYAMKTRLIDQYPFRDYSIKQEETKKRCISVKQLRELYYFNCPKRQEIYRDYFFLMFFLIGVNAKDLLLAKLDAVQNGRFEYIRAKTGKRYSIKIEPEAQALIDKYKGEDYLLEAMDRCVRYECFLHEINDELKLIGPEVEEEIPGKDLFDEKKRVRTIKPIIPNISSYYSRHTWATLAYEIGVPVDIISQALGHSIGKKTTLVYIKQDQAKIDEANRKVIDYLFDKKSARGKK